MRDGTDVFSVALTLAQDPRPTDHLALLLVAQADGSVERLLEAVQHAECLARELPEDAGANRVAELLREAACHAARVPSTTRRTALSDRLAGTPADEGDRLDVVTLEADLERLRT